MHKSDRSIWIITSAVILLITAIHCAPMFLGKVPFPAVLVFGFPPFASSRPADISVPQPDIGDLVTSFYPFRTLAARSVRDGSVPLWNPYMLSGTPFLANAQSAVFYPPNVAYYVLPVPVAWAFGFPLRILLAAFFTTLFVRRIGGSTLGAIVSGLLFAFCGFLTAWQGQAMADAAVWLPLICYSVINLRSSPSLRGAALCALAFSMPVLAGHPETAIHLTLMGTTLAIFAALTRESDSIQFGWNGSFPGYFLIGSSLAIGLAAVQLLPTIEWLQYTHRSFVDTWPPLPLWTVLAFASRDIVRATNSIGLHIPEHAAYMGILSFLVVPVALLHRSRRFVVFFALAAAAAFSIIYGIGPLFWASQHVPIIKIVKNHRMLLLASFSLSVLAGLGMTALERLSNKEERFRAAMLVMVGASLALMMVFAVRAMTDQVTEFYRFPRFSMYLIAGNVALIAWKISGRLRKELFGSLIIVVLAIDLLTFARGAIQFTAPRDIFPSIELFDRFDKQIEPFRIAKAGLAYGANFEVMYGLATPGGYDITLERLKKFTADITENDMSAVNFTTDALLGSRDRRLDMLNSKYFVISQWDSRYMEFKNQPDRFRYLFTAGDTDVYENLRVLPAAFLVPATGIETIADEGLQLERIKDPAYAPLQSVVLSEMPLDSFPEVTTTDDVSAAKVEWTRRGTNDFELNVMAPVPSVLVLSQTYYPGWKANVDGNAMSVFPANYALSAILVPQGSHQVRFSFEPFSFRLGLLLTAVSALIIILSFSLRARSR